MYIEVLKYQMCDDVCKVLLYWGFGRKRVIIFSQANGSMLLHDF